MSAMCYNRYINKCFGGKKMKNKLKNLLALLLAGIMALSLVACTIEGDTPSNSSSNNTSENEGENKEEKLLYSDDNIKVTYVKFTETQGVTTFNLFLKIENNMDKKVTVSLTDGYANDTSVWFFTGMPVEILPSKNAVGGFGFGYANLGIDSIDDIKKLEFKITLRDSENFSDVLLETDSITVSFE